MKWLYGFSERADGVEYMIQSEHIRGEPRVYYAKTRDGKWSGPSRFSEKSAIRDAEKHAKESGSG